VPEGVPYSQFVDERTKAARVNGVYILIVRKGGHVHVAADQETARLFTKSVRDQLAQQLNDGLRKGQPNFDNTLSEAMQFISDTFDRGERQPGGTAAAPPPRSGNAPPVVGGGSGGGGGRSGGGLFSSIWGWLCLIAGVWIVIALVRSIFRHRSGYPSGPGYGGGGPGPGYGGYGGGGYGYGGGGGGGWGSSLLGGLFGAAAGSWMYDHFFRSGTSYGASPPVDAGGYQGGGAPSSPDWVGPSDTGQGYESSDAGGGADFGGGGGGGGGMDFGGGGDAGGGGGGGGGDFGGGGGGGDAGGGGDFA
jgi:uncharacterized protein